MYFDDESKDFHFTRVNEDGTSNGKTPFTPVKEEPFIPDAIQNYKFDRYFLAPKTLRNAFLAIHPSETKHEILAGRSTSFTIIKNLRNYNYGEVAFFEKTNRALNTHDASVYPLPPLPGFRTDYTIDYQTAEAKRPLFGGTSRSMILQ